MQMEAITPFVILAMFALLLLMFLDELALAMARRGDGPDPLFPYPTRVDKAA